MPESRSDELRLALTDALLPISPGLVYDPVSPGADPAPLEIELRKLENALLERQRRALQFDVGPVARPRPRDLVRALQRGPAAARYGPRVLFVPAAPSTVTEVQSLARRARIVQRDAEIAIRRIERNRRFRDVPVIGQDSLYQQIDVPRLVRMREVKSRAALLSRAFRQLTQQARPTEERARQPPRETRVTALRRSAGKTVPELYERWLMLQVVRALVRAGFRGGTVQDALAATGSDYLADFDSETPVRFDAGPGRSLAVHFEPWVHPQEIALSSGAALYRPGAAVHSWRPDLIAQVELIGPGQLVPIVSGAIVIDAKAAPVVGLEHWHQVQKYREIRASHNDTRVIRHVCIATPGRLASAPAELVHGAGVVPELVRLSPLPEQADLMQSELDRVVAFIEQLLHR